MKKIFNFTKKKKDANTSDTGSVHSVGYELKDKDLGKVHKAALVGDLSKLRQHVKKNDINQLDKENRTALHIACANGHAEVVQFLAESKANLNLRDNQNRSPMMKAVQCQHAQCLVPLLEHNADPNLVDINGNSALHLAADIPSMPITMLLLEHDANINIKNKAGFTPLTISINGNHVEIAEFLLKEGADVNTKDHELRTPLMMAACSGHISMVRLLLQHNADITLKDTNGWSSDDYAVMNGNHACSHLIIEYETKRNTIPPSSLTTPRKKKKDSDMGSPSKGVDASFSLGGPATDKDDDEDISQSDSISRASKRADDDWPSSDEEDELDSSHQKPQKLNLKKIIAATKALDKPERYWSRVESEHDCKDKVLRTSIPTKASLPSKAPNHPIAAFPDSFSKAPQTVSDPFLSPIKSNSDGMSNKDMPHIDTDGVDADSSEEEDFQKTGQSQVRGLEKLVKVNDQVKYPIKKVKDDEERNEDEEAKGNIKDNAEEEEHSYFISSQNLPERNISQDKERDFLTELGLEKGDNEDSWDSESFSGSPKKQHGDTLSPEMKKVTALEKSQQAVLNDNAQTISDHDGGDGNGPIDKKEKMKKEPLSVLNQLEQVADKNTDFMEELGLGEVDDLEEPTDWDTASTTSKGSAFGRKEIPPRVKKLEGGSAQFPVPLPSVKKIEQDSPSVENSAAKLDPPPIQLSLGAPEKESSPEPEFDAETSENGLEEQKPVLEVEQNETGQSQKEQKLEATESFNHPSASSPKRSISGGHERRQSTCETTMAEDFDELTLSTDTASDDIEPPNTGYCHASLLFKQLELTNLDSVNMVKLQNMFHEYERTIQNERNHHGRLTDKLKCMESVKGELQSNLEDIKDQKLTLEHKLLELQTDINNLKFQLKQEQQKHRNASMMYENTKEQLQRKEEQHSLEAEERQKLELSLRNLELEMRAITNNMKQLEEDHSETQKLLAQERSSRALQENLLKNHLRKQQDSEEDNRSKSNEALSQLTEASDRERELLQQIAVLQDELSCLRKDLELSCSHRQQEECRLTEENKTLKERLEDHRRNFKLKEEDFAQTVFQYNGQLAVLKTEQAMAATRLEHEQQIRQQLELEVESANSRLAGALQEATLCQAARAESEKDLQRKKEEIIRIQDKCMGEMTSQRESIGDLSQKLSKMEVRANSLENEVHRTHLQLTEKTLLLDMLQQEKEQSTYQIKELETTLHAEREQASEAGARQGAVRERLAQAQSEAMLLRQQLEDSQNRAVGKETAVIDAQKSFSDILAQLRLDCEDRVQLVEERSKELAGTAANLREQVYNLETEKNSRETESRQLQQELADALKKLSMSEASLEVNTRYRSDLEEEKVHLLKDINEQKKKQEESAAAYVQAEQRINTLKTSFENKEQELTSANQKLEGALLDTAGLYKTIKQLEEAVQRLEIENARLEGGKHQSNTIAALQKAGQEVTSVEMEKKRAKKIMEQQKSVDLRLDQEMKRNTDLQKEVYRLRSLLKTTKKKLKEKDGAGAEFASSSSVRGENGGHGHSEVASGRMKDKGEELQGRLEKEVAHGSQIKRSNAQLNEHLAKKCPRCSKEGLQKSRKQADDEVSERWWQVESGLLDQSQTEQYHQNAEERVRKEIKQKLEEVNIFLQTQAASQEALDQIKAKNEASLQSHLELRIQDLEDQLVRARSSQHESQHNSTHTELERYRDLYNEELRHRKALAAKLERLNDKSLVSSSIANGSMGGPLLEIGSFASTGLEPKNRSMSFGSPVCNLMTDGQSNRIEAYLAKFQNEMAINISKELKQASAELQADYSGSMFPLGSPKNLETERDPISRATQQYMEVLKKNFMI